MSSVAKRNRGGRPRAVRPLDNIVNVRVDAEDLAELAAAAERFQSLQGRSSVARSAMRLGLALLEQKPELILAAGQAPAARAEAIEQWRRGA